MCKKTRVAVLLIIFVLLAYALVGCTNKEETTKLPEMQNISEVEKNTIGALSLEQCASKGGIYIAYDDGSFDEIPGGGYCYGISQMTDGIKGMFLENDTVECTPAITSDMKVVVFSASEYYFLNAYSIHHEVAAIQYTSDNGTKGYGRLSYEQNTVYVYYRNHESEDIKIEFINGEPSENYNAVKIEREVYPYKGMTTKKFYFGMAGFQPADKVKLGIVKGTTVVEKSYPVNITYFDCDSDHNNWDEEDQYYLEATPTVEGYAVIDFTELPTGRYVLVYEYVSGESRYYVASLLDWRA